MLVGTTTKSGEKKKWKKLKLKLLLKSNQIKFCARRGAEGNKVGEEANKSKTQLSTSLKVLISNNQCWHSEKTS